MNKDNNILTTGRLIRAVMEYRDISMEEFSTAIGEDKMNAYKILRGKRRVTESLAVKIGKCLNMSPLVIMNSSTLESLGYLKNE